MTIGAIKRQLQQPSLPKLAATWLLEAAERFYLRAHGWRRDGKRWLPPSDYPFRYKDYHTRGHAVNSQKQLTYNPMHGGTRSEQPG